MKVFMAILLTVILASLLLSGACTSSPSTSPSSNAPASTSASPVAAPGAIELSLAHQWPTTHIIHTGQIIPWTQLIEEKTAGKIKFNLYPAGTLLKAADLYTGVQSGAADIAMSCTTFNSGRFTVINIDQLPLLELGTAVDRTTVLQATFDNYPELLQKEFPNMKCLWISTPPAWQLLMREKPVKTLEDLKGQKIVCAVEAAPIFTAIGAVTVDMPQADQYIGLERGMIDGLGGTWASINSFKFFEVGKHLIETNLYGGPCYMVMNQNKWNSLPADVQQVFNEYTWSWAIQNIAAKADAGDEIGKKVIIPALEAKGGSVTSLPQAEMDKWKTYAQPIWENWIKETEAKGVPARDFFYTYTSIRDEYLKTRK